MIEGLPDVPPALLLILKEWCSCDSWDDLRLGIKKMLPDLRAQSEGFINQNILRASDSKDSLRFEIHLHGAMDLLSGEGCRDLDCRISAAKRIAQSFGLIADRVWLTDFLSEKFVDIGRPTNKKLDEIIADVLVLSELLPLMAAGVIRFRSPLIPACSSCLEYFNRHVEKMSEELTYVFKSEFVIEKRQDGGFISHSGRCLEPPLIHSSISKKLKNFPSVDDYAKFFVEKELRSALWTAREASMTGGAVLSNSRVGLAGLLQQEGRLVDINTLLLMDKERELSVPWVSKLDASQIVELRDAASSALPLFREAMCRAISISDQTSISSTTSSSIIANLREQAAEVRVELESKRKHSARYWKVTYGVLGLGLSAYGVATDQVIPGVGGLLPVIQLLIGHKSCHESELSRLTTKPGFVLVKAQDILAHAN